MGKQANKERVSILNLGGLLTLEIEIIPNYQEKQAKIKKSIDEVSFCGWCNFAMFFLKEFGGDFAWCPCHCKKVPVNSVCSRYAEMPKQSLKSNFWWVHSMS